MENHQNIYKIPSADVCRQMKNLVITFDSRTSRQGFRPFSPDDISLDKGFHNQIRQLLAMPMSGTTIHIIFINCGFTFGSSLNCDLIQWTTTLAGFRNVKLELVMTTQKPIHDGGRICVDRRDETLLGRNDKFTKRVLKIDSSLGASTLGGLTTPGKHLRGIFITFHPQGKGLRYS